MLSIIVAKSKNNVIGKENKLIWNIPDDMKRFRNLTSNHTIIMGRKTFESIGRVLPNRKHIILTKNKDYKVENQNVIIITDINELDKYIEDENENFVIGGAKIYNLLINKCQKLYITQIEKDFEGDSFFPEIDEKEWKIERKEKGPKDNNDFEYSYIDYIRD
jgi:dihydrofolate reductase